MSAWLRLAIASAWNRRATLGLTVLAVTLSVAMLLGVERLRGAARESFALSVSGTDLVVGARTSPVQLMLYAVFRLGEATNNMGWTSYQTIAAMPQVAWAVPVSLGDSHRGFPVLGTTTAYFQRFRYGFDRPLVLRGGRPFSGTLDGVFEAVLGSEVAGNLGYRLEQQVTLSHGSGSALLPEHKDKPFRVVGILAPTGTPVDRTVHVSLQAIEAIHLDWQAGMPMPGLAIPPELVRKFDLTPRAITAVLVGLQSRGAVFRVQRAINAHSQEPLVAVLPGVALDQLWQVVGIAERAMLAVTGMIVVIGLAGLVAVLLASLNERRRELAILRSVGAGPWQVAGLVTMESTLATATGIVLGAACLAAAALLAAPWLQSTYGLTVAAFPASASEWWIAGAVLLAGVVAGLVPALVAARLSLADGLTPRL
ncbi:MAG TPA: ABC transporter permease [Ramlibacter sp.]|nr:ABC transporter permease [Ramlibacter sp.]